MKHSFKVLFIISICLFSFNIIVACGSHKKQNKKDSIAPKQSTTKVDTTKEKTVKPVKEKYSPGTAEITARVIMYNETNPYRVTLKVLSVKGYGSATPHLAKNNELKVNISKAILNNHKLDEVKKKFTSVKPVTVLLRSNQGMALGHQSGPSWTIIDYH